MKYYIDVFDSTKYGEVEGDYENPHGILEEGGGKHYRELCFYWGLNKNIEYLYLNPIYEM